MPNYLPKDYQGREGNGQFGNGTNFVSSNKNVYGYTADNLVSDFGLRAGEYAVHGGQALMKYGVRDKTFDIDVYVSRDQFESLKEHPHVQSAKSPHLQDRLQYSNPYKVEFFHPGEEWYMAPMRVDHNYSIRTAQEIDDVPYASVSSLKRNKLTSLFNPHRSGSKKSQDWSDFKALRNL